jgi:uncharacterized protein YcnI
LGIAGAGALVVGVAGPASAHVGSKATAVTPSGVSTVRFTFDHGCGTSPTVSLRIKLPADATEVSPGAAPNGWTATTTDGVLEWQGPGIADGTPAAFNTTVRLVGTKGDTVFLPTVQTCEQGTNDWIELPVDGQPEPEFVAPSVTLLATVAAPATTTTSSTTSTTPPSTEAAPVDATPGTTSQVAAATTATADDGGGGMSMVPLVIGGVAVVVVGGGIAVARGRRSDARSDASS